MSDAKHLIPEKLTHEATLTEFKSWRKRYQFYFYFANLQFAPPVLQYGTLVNLVNYRLTNELDNFAHSNSVTFNANNDITPMDSEPIPSFMQILQNYFKTIDPVHVHRSQLCEF